MAVRRVALPRVRASSFSALDPQKQIVDVTVNGTQNVLSSCVKAAGAGTFRRFVQISSIAAIQDNNRPVDHTYTEIDFNESATVARDPYSVSKLLSERLATNFVAELPPESCFTCAFVNPGASKCCNCWVLCA